MSTDVDMTPAADAAKPVPAAPALYCSQLPTGQTMHSIYLRQLSGAQAQTLKNASQPNQLDFSLLNADLIVDLFQLECAAVKSSLQALRGKLKTKNIHSEFAFNLGYSGHFQTSIEFLSCKPEKDAAARQNVLICMIHATDAKLAQLNALIASFGEFATPLSQLRSNCNQPTIVKHYKIADSELGFNIPATPYTAAGASSSTSSTTAVPPNDTLLQAVVGRIHLKI